MPMIPYFDQIIENPAARAFPMIESFSLLLASSHVSIRICGWKLKIQVSVDSVNSHGIM